MYERKAPTASQSESARVSEVSDVHQLDPEPNEYRPWILQRGSGRPAMLLDLRRYDPKTGTLTGSLVSYPQLMAVDYWGDRVVTLDFGSRHYVIEGAGLGDLPRWLQQGAVLAIQEYSSKIWPRRGDGALISKIAEIDANNKP
jgi:hypothetical protein